MKLFKAATLALAIALPTQFAVAAIVGPSNNLPQAHWRIHPSAPGPMKSDGPEVSTCANAPLGPRERRFVLSHDKRDVESFAASRAIALGLLNPDIGELKRAQWYQVHQYAGMLAKQVTIHGIADPRQRKSDHVSEREMSQVSAALRISAERLTIKDLFANRGALLGAPPGVQRVVLVSVLVKGGNHDLGLLVASYSDGEIRRLVGTKEKITGLLGDLEFQLSQRALLAGVAPPRDDQRAAAEHDRSRNCCPADRNFWNGENVSDLFRNSSATSKASPPSPASHPLPAPKPTPAETPKPPEPEPPLPEIPPVEIKPHIEHPPRAH